MKENLYEVERFPQSPDDYYSFERVFERQLIKEVFQLTCPSNHPAAGRYRNALEYINKIPRQMDQFRPFYELTNPAKHRLLFYAIREMRLVHRMLRRWIQRSFPHSTDYCYDRGLGREAAINVHKNSRFGYVADLEHAFWSVNSDMLANRFEEFLPDESHEIIPALTYLLTVDNHLRQGTRCAPYAYNFCVKPLHDQLAGLAGQFGVLFTRYSDDIAFTSSSSFNILGLQEAVLSQASQHGFPINKDKNKLFNNEPIVYVGAGFLGGEVLLKPSQVKEYLEELKMALQSSNPLEYRESFIRKFSYTVSVCGQQPADESIRALYAAFEKYFSKVRTPASAAAVFAQQPQHQSRLPGMDK